MNIFGIPIFVPYDTFYEFISTQLPTLTNLTSDGLLVGYILINAIYIFCLYLFFKVLKFVTITFLNRLF